MSMLAPDASKIRTIAHPAKSETTETHKVILEIIIYEQTAFEQRRSGRFKP